MENDSTMDDGNFSSLMELVNSHLSKTSLTNPPGEAVKAFPLASVSIQTGKSQTVFTPPNGVISIPRLMTHDHEINGILAQQVTNMLIANEKKKQEEEAKQKLAEEQKEHLKLKDDYVIDLMSSIIKPDQILDQMVPKSMPDDKASSSSSGEVEILPIDITHLSDDKEKCALNMKMVLPLQQDLSYMLFRKVKRGRPSAFGKVISARLKPRAAPYLRVNVHNPLVKRFDFSTKSPCDINLEKRLHRPQDPYAHMNMVERFMAQTNNDAV